MGASTAAAALGGGRGSSLLQASRLGGMWGNSPSLQRALAMQRFNNRTSAKNAAIAAAADTSDPNNLSATGIGAANIVQNNDILPMDGTTNLGIPGTNVVGNTTVGDVSAVSTGGFTPQDQNVARGIYGDQVQRDASFEKKKLINLI